MKRIRVGLWIASGLMLLALSASAQEPADAPDYARDSFYFAAQGNYAFPAFGKFFEIDAFGNLVNGLGLGGAPVPGDTAEPTAGAGARVGYRSGRVGMELHFEWLDGFDLESRTPAPTGTLTTTIGEATAYTSTLNGRFFLLTGRVQPYFVGGIGASYFVVEPTGAGSKGKNVNFVGRVGGGAEFYFTERVGLFGEFSHVFTTGNIGGLDYSSIAFGVLARF